MIPEAWRDREVAVIGLARTGQAVCRWLATQRAQTYASDISSASEIREAGSRLRSLGVEVEVGRHDLDRIARAAAVIVSPGVPPDAPAIKAARDAGVPVRAELDVAASALRNAHLIVITGTNGKSTTTALIAHILRSTGLNAAAAGNIGRPLIEVALDPNPPDWVVVEASSFQLHDSPSLCPAVGVVTNLAPDHLDRYSSVDQYYADKKLLFRNADARSSWVLNGDDKEVLELARGAPGRKREWRMGTPADAWLDRESERILVGGTPVIPRSELPLLGDHNVENALAAALAAAATGIGPADMAAALRTFQGLAHRLEVVREKDGVLWINDSKATNLASSGVAIRSMDRPFILILGGRHKGEPYTVLAPILAERCRGVIAFGESAPLVKRDLENATDVMVTETLTQAVERSRTIARGGEAVLLSPACSSFDQFANYEERGELFRSLVEG